MVLGVVTLPYQFSVLLYRSFAFPVCCVVLMAECHNSLKHSQSSFTSLIHVELTQLHS